MREPVKRLNGKSLGICLAILVGIVVVEVICSFALGGKINVGGGKPPKVDQAFEQYTEMGIELDPNVVSGMFNPDEETGDLNPFGTLAFRINDKPSFKTGAAKGNLQIENHADNQHLMRVVIALLDSGEVVYESGYIPPNARVLTATLDVELEKGEYEAEATIQAYEIDEEQTYIGDIGSKAQMTITVQK